MLDIGNLTLRFGGLTVLNHVQLQARPGEVTALIGPNGAGKSALLNCISGHYKPEDGATIMVDKIDICNLPSSQRASCGLSRTFQHIHLVPELDVIENIMTGLTPVMNDGVADLLLRPIRQAQRERVRRAQANEAIETFGLRSEIHSRVEDLPLGIQRKVDFARATMSRPKVLLLDEPASGMSRNERRLIPAWIEQAKSRSASAIIWIEHDMDLLLSSADAVVVLQHGEVVATGRPKDNPDDRQRVVDAYFNYRH